MTPRTWADPLERIDELEAVNARLRDVYGRLWHRHRALQRRLRWEIEADQDHGLPSPHELAHEECG